MKTGERRGMKGDRYVLGAGIWSDASGEGRLA